MKKLILSALVLFISLCAYSQDLIITHSGQRIKCNITGEDSSRYYITIIEHNNNLDTSIKKSSVKNIQYGAVPDNYFTNAMTSDYLNCGTFGVLQGGGGLVGMDLEFKVSDRVALQAGAGLVSFGGGINFHFRPTLRSSFIALQYWHQGVGESFTQSLVGPSLVYRGPRWLTAQIGIGFTLDNGPAWPEDQEIMPAILTYAIGAYFPF